MSHSSNLTTLSIGCIKRNQKDEQRAKARREEPTGAIKENKRLPDHPCLQRDAQSPRGTARLQMVLAASSTGEWLLSEPHCRGLLTARR